MNQFYRRPVTHLGNAYRRLAMKKLDDLLDRPPHFRLCSFQTCVGSSPIFSAVIRMLAFPNILVLVAGEVISQLSIMMIRPLCRAACGSKLAEGRENFFEVGEIASEPANSKASAFFIADVVRLSACFQLIQGPRETFLRNSKRGECRQRCPSGCYRRSLFPFFPRLPEKRDADANARSRTHGTEPVGPTVSGHDTTSS